MRNCLKALGWAYDHSESSHEVWVDLRTRHIAVLDTNWTTVASNMVSHFVRQEIGLSRDAFYGATKVTRRKIGKR